MRPATWSHGGAASPSGEAAGEWLQGTVEVVTYHDPAGLWTVLRLAPEEGFELPEGQLFEGERLTAVGKLPDPAEGMRLRLFGRWQRHAAHGTQFAFDSAEPLIPSSEEGLARYLASKAFSGIGETLARRIVQKLGAGALERIQEDPGALDGIRGLRPAAAASLAAAVRARLQAHKAGAFLRGLGLGPIQTQAALARFGGDCEALVRANPYRLAEVTGMGFATADRVAGELGIAGDDPRRLRAGLLHALESATEEGHCFVPVGELCERSRALLRHDAPRAALVAALGELEQREEVAVERALAHLAGPWDDAAPVYPPGLLGCERGLARGLHVLLAEGRARPLASAEELAKAEHEAGIALHPTQRAAVLTLLASPVAVLTGGPGVGKTTIVRLVVALAEREGFRVRLASPTGRAAKRLSEATGRPASTIHRLLRFDPEGGGFVHGPEKPLRAGLLIVDEISMLDLPLAYQLVRALRPPTRLVLVGDPDQLPSVQPGNVLRDLLDSGRLPVARLSHVYRQDSASRIVANAHAILAGEMPSLPARGDRASDFYFFAAEEAAEAADLLVDVVTRRIPASFGFDWRRDVQVIAPMYRGECGVDALNERLREAQGSGGREVVRGGRRWRTGDRVIQVRNDYDKEVFNGDMGTIAEVSAEGQVRVRYPDQDVLYSGGELSDLLPAFAITVHRSQGGEFPVVVLPLVMQHRAMLQRNLLYTAVTRARKLVVVVGSRRALWTAIENAEQRFRRSALAERLRREGKREVGG